MQKVAPVHAFLPIVIFAPTMSTTKSGKSGPNVNPVLAALFEALLFTGARRGELATLRWDQVNIRLRIAEIESKTGPRIVYFNVPAMRVLRRMQGVNSLPTVTPVSRPIATPPGRRVLSA